MVRLPSTLDFYITLKFNKYLWLKSYLAFNFGYVCVTDTNLPASKWSRQQSYLRNLRFISKMNNLKVKQ